MTIQIVWKCVNCGDNHTAAAAFSHNESKGCPEWGNHMMSEARFVPEEAEVCEGPHDPMFEQPWMGTATHPDNFCRTCGVWFNIAKETGK